MSPEFYFQSPKRISFLLFCIVFFTNILFPIFPKADSNWALPTALSLVLERNTNLDEYVNLPATQQLFPERTQKIDGHSYDYFPLGSALLAIPQVFILIQINGSKELLSHSPEAGKFVASSWMALAAVLIYLCFRKKFGNSIAILSALLFAFATPALSTGGRSMWQQSGSLFVNCILFFLLVRGIFEKKELLLLGFFLGFDIWVRPSTIVFTLPIFIYLILIVKRKIFWVAAGGILPAILYFAYNMNLYGSPTPPYFNGHIHRVLIFSHFWTRLGGILFSPSRGIFIWSPFFLFGVFGFIKLKTDPDRFLSLLFLSCILTHIFLIASFDDWWGGHSIGPRLLAEITPFLLWFAIKGILSLPEIGFKNAVLRNLWVATCIFSAVVHIRSSVDLGPTIWNQVGNEGPRSWDWKDPQFSNGDWTIKLLY